MQTQIHPKWQQASVTCACGNVFTVGSTVPSITVEVCSVCHPFYTGTMKYVDTAGRVDKFRARREGAATKVLSKTDRREIKKQARLKEEQARPESLAELRKPTKSKK